MATDDAHGFDERVTAVAVLADPLRRRVYDAVVRGGEPVGRDAVAALLDLRRAPRPSTSSASPTGGCSRSSSADSAIASGRFGPAVQGLRARRRRARGGVPPSPL